MSQDPRVRLLNLLCERPDYQDAYRNLPEFKSVIDGIVAAMPAILQTAYDQARKAAEMKKTLTKEAMTRKPDPATRVLLGDGRYQYGRSVGL